ncbi:hypothetical protein [Vibrio breoganii]|uniref:hypothetical protein n=1 Tax=Vibrio breoganii TaxID=553239 RepID=UPI0010549B88|nr:hypothetical protein [Vibrio breoganii]
MNVGAIAKLVTLAMPILEKFFSDEQKKPDPLRIVAVASLFFCLTWMIHIYGEDTVDSALTMLDVLTEAMGF